MKKEELDLVIPQIIDRLKRQTSPEKILSGFDNEKIRRRFDLCLSELVNAVNTTQQTKDDDFYRALTATIIHYHDSNLPPEINPCPQSSPISSPDIVEYASILGRTLSHLS